MSLIFVDSAALNIMVLHKMNNVKIFFKNVKTWKRDKNYFKNVQSFMSHSRQQLIHILHWNAET